MSWIDWCIVAIPMILLIGVSIYSRKYARGVVDFLAAGGKKPLQAHFYGTKSGKMTLKSKEEVEQVLADLEGASYQISEVKKGERVKKAPLPFTTSTLQQEASKTLNFSTQKTMSVAQQLYEGIDIKGYGTVGVITYLRTDSTRVSEEAEKAAKTYHDGTPADLKGEFDRALSDLSQAGTGKNRKEALKVVLRAKRAYMKYHSVYKFRFECEKLQADADAGKHWERIRDMYPQACEETELLNKLETEKERAERAAHIAAARFDLSLDQMLGLPGQTEVQLEEFVAFADSARAAHLSSYILKESHP